MSIYTTAAQIASAINDRICAITQVNGCETDIGLLVLRGRRNVDESMIPCAVIIEGNDTVTDRPGRIPSVALTQRYVIGAYIKCDINNPNDAAHAAIRDIKKAIFSDTGALGGSLSGKALKVSYRGRDIGPRADSYPAVFATVDIDVEYVEDLTAP